MRSPRELAAQFAEVDDALGGTGLTGLFARELLAALVERDDAVSEKIQYELAASRRERERWECFEIVASAAEDYLAQHWAGGELPVGPGVSDAFVRAVRDGKELARAVLRCLDLTEGEQK